MNKKLLVIVLFLSVLMMFGCSQQKEISFKNYGQLGQGTGTNNVAEQNPKEAIVNIYDNGFRPEEVTIAVGGTVKWINKGQKDHSVSGPLFPMPSSNSPKTSGRLQPGESWTKKFDEAGYYGYTDIYDDNLKGKVIVK